MNKLKNILYPAVLLIFFAFTFQSNPPGWYQQNLPTTGNREINDVTFVDSLTGFLITKISQDSSYILKTINGGDNWNVIHKDSGVIMNDIQFFNKDSGIIGGTYLMKTINGGLNWTKIGAMIFSLELHFVNLDTGWYVSPVGLGGGVFRTTNGGLNWMNQLNIGGQNPDRIYMFNRNIGFIAKGGSYLKKTTNSGVNWFDIPSADGFTDIKFIDSLTGWKAKGDTFVKKTTNGGLNWTIQDMPNLGGLSFSWITKLALINKDTLWGIGGIYYTGSSVRAIIYKTTNGGLNWGYQLPDTSINTFQYRFITFTNSRNGWAYDPFKGVHTTTGGLDTTIYTSIKQISSEVPSAFKLEQNYPNPFNPTTKISFSVKSQKSKVKLQVFDASGKLISTLVNKSFDAGTYEVNFNAENLPSGVYFYTLISNNFKETKKMLLLK